MKNLTVLGCGDAFSSGGQFNTSFLVEDSASSFLIDCGATTLFRLQQMDYPVDRIDRIFISHFHGDHYGGLPFLIIHYAFQAKEEAQLTICGPKGLEQKVRNLQDAMYPETSSLFDELKVNFIEYNSNWMSVGDVDIKAFPVKHSPPSIPHGFRLKWNDKILSFSGDTEWTDSLVDLADNSELFIMECNNFSSDTPGHLSHAKIVEMKPRLKTKKIVLSHQGSEALSEDHFEFDRLKDGDRIPLW